MVIFSPGNDTVSLRIKCHIFIHHGTLKIRNNLLSLPVICDLIHKLTNKKVIVIAFCEIFKTVTLGFAHGKGFNNILIGAQFTTYL